MKLKIIIFSLCLMFLLVSCKTKPDNSESIVNEPTSAVEEGIAGLDLYVNDGKFDGGTSNLSINCLEGTSNAYTINNDVITFSNLNQDSVYSISGNLRGNIIIDIEEDYKLDLELHGLSIISESECPINVLNGDKVTITAKKDNSNYIYDYREETAEDLNAAIYSSVDLVIGGKGTLNIVSNKNGGVHTKKDLDIKNLDLTVLSVLNAVKGNDSVTIESGNLNLISSSEDGIKTSNTDISSKNNQRGNILILDGNINIYSACDGIDASHNVLIESGNVNIFTDQYSSYSDLVTSTDSEKFYLKTTSTNYNYSIKYIDKNEYSFVDAKYHSSSREGRSTYYYYTVDKIDGYDKFMIYTYSKNQELSQDDDYVYVTESLSFNDAYDTLFLKNNTVSFTNYQTQSMPGGFGGGFGPGMNEGNSDKKDYSTKGIKSDNEIIINNGNVNIESYDDCIHANNTNTLENGLTPTGDIEINGGNLSLFTKDDGIHADGNLNINGGNINISNSYEGIEGLYIVINNGSINISSKDDGVNSTSTSGEGIVINGGDIYISASGDGLDSNSRSSYQGIIFNGGNVVVISNSNGNSAIDTEAGYEYKSGYVVGIMSSGGMSNEAVHCSNFSNIGSKSNISISNGDYLEVEDIVIIKSNISINGLIVVLGNNKASISKASTIDESMTGNVKWL